MRIYELAKELGISKKDLVAKVRNLGFPVSNFMSPIDPDSIPRIRAHMERERQANTEQVQVSKAVFRRRRKDRPAGEEEQPQTVELYEGASALESGTSLTSPAGAPSTESRPEMDATERFKLALEEQLRQHLGRGPAQGDEGAPSSTESLRGRPKKGRGDMEEGVSARGDYDSDSGERYVAEQDSDYEAGQERESRSSSSLRPLARGGAGAPPSLHEEVPLSRLREEPIAPRPETPVEEPSWNRAAWNQEDEVGEVEERESTVAKTTDAAQARAAERPSEQERPAETVAPRIPGRPAGPQGPQTEPRVPRKPVEQRPTSQGAVVVAIPSLEERERRLGLTQQAKAAAAKGKKGKTTFTQRELYKDSAPFGRGGRATKKKISRSVGGKTTLTTPSEHKRIIRIDEAISVSELAQRMGVKASELILTLLKMGTKVSITQSLDADTATLVAGEFGYEVKNVAFQEEQVTEQATDKEEDLLMRAPVVTIMGHVDHGKTSLLDKIRSTKVAAGEAGGITQHIGAYNVTLDDGTRIVFLDTPGHEAFTAMRARGAQATDIVVLVVAANDGVQPQTIEAISHSRDAKVPIIVAINKIDMPGVNVDRIKQSLSDHKLLAEEWGGDTMMVPVSAKTGAGLDELLDAIRVQAEVMELRANPEKRATGVVLEASLESGRGTVATILVQQGTLEVGDILVAGATYGKVRAMADERGKRLKKAEPSTPVEVVGLTDVPASGDPVNVVADEKAARALVEHRSTALRRATTVSSGGSRDLSSLLSGKMIKDVKLIIKGDVHGSVEAVREALLKLSTDEVKVTVIHEGVGGVTEGDVMLASAAASKGEDTDVAVVAFNVRAKPRVLDLAASQGVRIKTYTIIYDAIEETKAMMAGMLAPITREKYLGRAEVRETFNIPKIGTIAGCTVQDGKIRRGARVRLLRNEIIVWEGKLSSLRRFKDDVREVTQGFECGIGLENYNDLHLEDIVEAYEMEEVAAEL